MGPNRHAARRMWLDAERNLAATLLFNDYTLTPHPYNKKPPRKINRGAVHSIVSSCGLVAAQLAFYFALFNGFNHVALFQVVKAFEADTEFVTVFHFAYIVFKAFQ